VAAGRGRLRVMVWLLAGSDIARRPHRGPGGGRVSDTRAGRGQRPRLEPGSRVSP